MGCGKSSVGRELASQLSVPFIDLDSYIEHKIGSSIPDILAEGEDKFRAIEAEALRDVIIMREIQDESAVISLGGGTITIKAIWHLLSGHTTCIYLRTRIETICQRLGDDTSSRPLFNRERYFQRLPLYEKAHLTVDTDGKEPAAIADEIKRLLKNND